MQYNFNIQSQLFSGTALTIGYLGSQSRKLIISRPVNVNQWVFLPDGRKCYPSFTPGTPCPGPQAGVMNPTWSNVTQASTEGNASYNALVTSVTQTLRDGLRMGFAYTYAKTISLSDTVFGADFTGDASAGLTDGYNAKMDRGLSGYGLKHSLTINYTYDLPFQKTGALGKVIGGWQMSGIIKTQSGIPFGVTTAFTPGNGMAQGGIAGGPAYRPDLVPGRSNNPTSGVSTGCGSVAAGTPVGTPGLWYDPCAFSNPAFGVYGNLGRHTLVGPSFNNVDFSLLKSTDFAENKSIQFRAEFFNIFNHPNFANPSPAVFDARGNRVPTAGLITSTVGIARTIQFGLKLVF
jgi:hypothetical protein